jgi:tRNA threonylcarbamoyladenosine biosynthesis protein TsaE
VVAFETSFVLTGEAATRKMGAQIAGGLQPGDVVALSGELGAGKTTLVRAILRALGVTEEVPSPTFTLVQSYETETLVLYHFDLYRLGSTAELGELGIEDALDEGAILVEWPENGLPARLLEDALRISIFADGPATRKIRLVGPARWRTVMTKDAQ